MVFQLCMKITNSLVGVGLYSGFRPPLESFEYQGKGISIYKRPRYFLTRKYLCHTTGGTPDPNEPIYEIFNKICLQMEDRKIISRMLKYRGSSKDEDLLNLVKSKGAEWLATNRPLFFRNANYIKSTKTCLWAELQSALLERTDEKSSILKVGFWYGAWKYFLVEIFSDPSCNIGIIAHESLHDVLKLNDEVPNSKDIMVDELLAVLRASIQVPNSKDIMVNELLAVLRAAIQTEEVPNSKDILVDELLAVLRAAIQNNDTEEYDNSDDFFDQDMEFFDQDMEEEYDNSDDFFDQDMED
uniref:Uncharacterized protein n=1 Tax=Lobelia chinensis TaxID=368926 RepID=A0A1Z2QWK9_9ASTR|nr:hypothetical protein Lo_chi1Pt0327 [Lobelia chinensis]ASA35863.1 hypothetical protein Lo_chi1Pt0327 [Lobelia chinensis]